EGGDCVASSKTDLAQRLSESANISLNAAESMLEMVEAVLDSESTLDQEKLKQGEWQFVSFAAQLMGMSRLATLADPKARDVPENFWSPTKLLDPAHKAKASHRLEKAEQARWDQVHNAGGTPLPIRAGHIVWCFIKLEDKFLFHRKEEDRSRSPGEFGPVGGKMSEADFPDAFVMADRVRLMNSDSLLDQKYDEVWTNAIQREINEEVAEGLMGENGLELGSDYSLSLLEPSLRPFSFCRGTDLIFSVAKYWFKLYSVQLTLRGYLKLKRNMSLNRRFLLASVEEMQNRTVGDAKLDIKALHEHYPGGFSALADKLDTMEQSFSMPCKNTKGVIIPASAEQAMEVCTTAKRVVVGMASLLQYECDLLIGMAAHARGWELQCVPDGIQLYCDGWVDASNNDNLRQQMLQLVNKEPTYFDVDDSSCFRISVRSEVIFLNPSVFSFFIKQQPITETTPLIIVRKELNTALGHVDSERFEHHAAAADAENLNFIVNQNGTVMSDAYVPCEKRAREQVWEEYKSALNKTIKKKIQQLGLRSLLKTDGKNVMITCCYDGSLTT
ncbi:MAG: hypothetical protein R8J85_10180, partial [Mariprofundales bacterium]